MRISDWPRAERPREKLLARGADTLTEAELLALLLRQGPRGLTAVDLARQLLVEFRSLRGLLAADQAALCSHRGVGPARYAELRAALELARRHHLEVLRAGVALESPRSTRTFLNAQLRDRPYEVFCCLFLDNRHRVLAFEELFRGTIDNTTVYPREVVRQALHRNAAAVILAHNHPSGVPEPSDADRLITRRIRDALELVDVRLLDHVVVGDGSCVSLASRGLL